MDTPNELMRQEEEKQKVSETPNWSNLSPDLLRQILRSLSRIDFHRTKLVCSNWYSVWKTCKDRSMSLCPWQLTYKGDSSVLFDPKEEKSYKAKLLGFSRESYCIASYGNCLLLVDSIHHFYIFNMLTRKRINLAPIAFLPIPRGELGDFKNVLGCSVLWINEKTCDYFVAWICHNRNLFSYNSSYKYGWSLKGLSVGLFDMAYKDNKLYLYTLDHHIKILDFSGCCREYHEVRANPYQDHPFRFVEKLWEFTGKRKIAIRRSGEVLIILSLKEVIQEEKVLFYVFKMNLESGEWERVYSIGDDDEMLIFGHGVTIRAPVRDTDDGIKSDSICFVDDDLWPGSDRPSNCGIFDLATGRITWPKRFGAYIDQTQWFVPAST